MSNPHPTSPTGGTTLPQLPRYASFEDFMARSSWWARLKSFNDPDVEHLRASIQHVADQAESIASRVTAWMPFYTLHDRRHQLNLLAFIDVLAPEETLVKLFPLEIGLTILGVLTHDLGMALPDPERKKLLLENEDTPERRAYLQFAEGRYSDELRQADRLMKSTTPSDQARGQLIQQHILSEYLRSTHAPPSGERINAWLNEMKREDPALFRFNKTDYQSELKAIAASHNQPVDWLRSKLAREDQGYHHVVRTNERVNFALPGLLLRLADIMDFDSTRTPAILFRHLGLNEDLGVDLSNSHREWRKHLAIDGIEIKEIDKQPTMTYAAPHCPHPVVQKSIHEFVGWIAEEVRGAREENRRQWHDLDLKVRACELWLPEVKAEIRPKKQEDGQPAYIYEDIQFKLDQDEILQLLMGERLYGDPTLCIRELLQNALDACEMRDLRLQMKAKKQKPFEPVDGIPSERGWYLDSTGEKRRLEIRLSWGFDEHEQRYWLQVEDNGIGMTQEVVKRYFTQIGKSYYRSPEFRQEQAALRTGGMFATPISQFGIGILSCFMLADQIEVQTCPGESHPETRPARDITISGPGSLFWLRKGTRTEQGTRVKLWLKTKLGQQELKLEHAPERWLDGLRAHFGYAGDEDFQPPDGVVDPAFAAGQWIIWPRYPLVLNGPQLRTPFELNDRFHLDHIAPINEAAVKAKAAEWGVAPKSVGQPVWGFWEWEDSIGPEATGSRVRLCFPLHDAEDQAVNSLSTKPQVHQRCRRQLLAAFTEPQLESEPWMRRISRERLMLHGIDVPETDPLQSAITIGAGVGTRVWFDLRGAAGARLTADRKTALAPENADAWTSCIEGLTARLTKAFKDVAFESEDATRAVFSSWSGPVLLALREQYAPYRPRNSFHQGWIRSAALETSDWQFVARAFEQEFNLDHALARDIELALDLDRSLDRDFDPALDRDRARALDLARARARDLDLARALALARDRDLSAYQKFQALSDGLKAAFLQEGFFPDLRRSWAGLDLFWMRGMIGNAMLAGPELLCFEYEADGCTVHPTDLAGEQPREVVRWGYDLVFPTTAIPLGQLRRRCVPWRQRREPRRLGILPFICPSFSIDADACAQFRKYFDVDRIYALLPSQELWSKPFAEWQDLDWQHADNLSALWDLENNIVRWAKGAKDVDWIRQNGLPAAEFFGLGPSE